MTLSTKQMLHPQYWHFEHTAQIALDGILFRHLKDRSDIRPEHERQAGRLIDDIVALLIRLDKTKT